MADASQGRSRPRGLRLSRQGLTGLPPRAALALLAVTLSGTFAAELVPFGEPRLLNYMTLAGASTLSCLARLWRRPSRETSLTPIATGWLVAFNAYLLISNCGADGEVLAKLAMFELTVLNAWLLARLLAITEIIDTLFWVCLSLVLVSSVVALAAPDIGTMRFQRGEAWSGLYEQKNAFGRLAALTGLLSVLRRRNGAGRPACWLGLGLAIAALVMSMSRTAMMLFLLGTPLVLLATTTMHRRWAFLTLGLIAAVGLAQSLVIVGYDRLELSASGIMLGDEFVDLTGRLPIWEFCWWLYLKEPVWGAGFDAIWSYHGGSALYESLGWQITDSHNGYLDTLVQTGAAGVGLYGALMILMATRALKAVLADEERGPGSAFGATIVLLYLIINITSCHTLEGLSVWNFLFLLVCFRSDRHAGGRRSPRAALQCHYSLPQPSRSLVSRHSIRAVPILDRV
ncbi:O-antigen ligase [Rhodoligotrophos appendicifer]|uniref:O-antigen ligase family protein n=1 Tax=Rhodoligotrophos appendicifer TaxID=987056 RepID=UPI00118560C4|nr:O-antigen ligase family protein [Rhodoligotrophos appendicifer]